ncbi:class I SAM-dependent methyltransferase [Paenibacillus sp. CMAA1364]
MEIGNVSVNLDYYSGQDLYSDGTVENEIFEYLKKGLDIDKLLRMEDRWAVLYHLSPTRRNLLEWMEFSQGSKTLEIGAGCGALTGLLCEKSSQVTSIELSLQRAKILAERHKNCDNLEVIVGNLNDVPLADNTYDYVSLIGVLEYAEQFTQGSKPFSTFLGKIFNTLAPKGTLILAIENKFGLKYWAGAREDHTGIFFDGLEGYPRDAKAKTFGKIELEDLLYSCGFSKLEFHYPFPDYKMPKQVYSDESLPGVGFNGESPNYDMDRLKLFNESLVYSNIIKNGQFPFFANSFLVLCEKNGAGENNEQ